MRTRTYAAGIMAAAVLAGAAYAQQPAPAPAEAPPPPDNPCNDVPETECAGVQGCVWIPGFKVASGATVLGYCRPAPKPLTARRGPVQEQR